MEKPHTNPSHIVTLHDDFGDTLTTWCGQVGDSSHFHGVTDKWVSRQDYFAAASKVTCDDCRKALQKAKS